MILDFTTPPSKKLYDHVRAGFIAHGDTLTTWAKRKGYNQQDAKDALCGVINSPRAIKIRKDAIMAINTLNQKTAS